MTSTPSIFSALIITLLTLIYILNGLRLAQASVQPFFSKPKINPQHIGGRWQLVQASLGLEPSTNITLEPSFTSVIADATIRPFSRVDFRRRKRTAYPPLHFSQDALREQKNSLNELVASFRRIAYEEEKAEVPRSDARKGRNRLGRNTFRKAHITTPH